MTKVIFCQDNEYDQEMEGSFFTSNVGLQKLLVTENEIVTELTYYIEFEKARLEKLSR